MRPEDIEILYGDEHLVVINKTSGLLVHRGWATDEHTAMSLVRDRLGTWVHTLHRLDRATSGVLLFALSKEIAADLRSQFAERRMFKRYLGLVRGRFEAQVELDHPVRKKEKGSERVEAVTTFRCVQVFGPFEELANRHFSLIEALPKTGRLHQIRRHLKHLSHPLVGDVNYGKGDINRFFRERFGLNRLALHAAELGFVHPVSGQALSITAPIPDDLRLPLQAMAAGVRNPSEQVSSFYDPGTL